MEPRLDASYVPLSSRASWAKGMLLLAGAVDAVALYTGYSLLHLTDEAQQGALVLLVDLEAAESRHALVGTIQIAAYLVAGLVFIRWFHRAYANLPAVGVEKLNHRPGWAIGAWFIPLASFVWPKRIADEIWRGSDPEAEDPARVRVPSLFGAWWRTFIVAGLLVAVGANVAGGAETYQQYELGMMAEFVGNLLGIASGVLAYLVVDRTSDRQHRRAAKLSLWRPAPLA